ncbi:MAG TPA: glycosyltransferase [Thermoanaerobaculia bacterium]|nr:glycosyltransferase [Thermoanaerobaculia bacterium]
MKILHVAATATGAPWMVALAREQQRLGHEVAAAIPSLDGGLGDELARAGIRAYAAPVDFLVSARGPLRKLVALVQLVRLLRRLRPDLVHSHIFGSVIAARLASWLADTPLHFAGNVHPISLESDLMRALDIGTAFCDARTIASSTYTRELYAAHGVDAELIFYAVDQSGHDPARADGARVRRELGLAPDARVIGKIAYFYPPPRTQAVVPPILRGRGIKGHDVLLRAVPRVLESFPDAKFVLAGRGWDAQGARYEASLKELAQSLGVAHAVLFPGERSDVVDVLAAFDVSVHCSLSDNLGGTVESLLMERPMVVSDARGFADTVLHEQTGLVVPKDDPIALADAIVRLLRDRELAARLGRNGRAHMLSRFTLAHMVADTEALLARTPLRRGYRLHVTLARLLAAPFRLLPMALRARRALRGTG